jgi:hypothetical protein
MVITKANLLEHAVRFDFKQGPFPSDLVRVEKVYNSTTGDYWTVKWGDTSRWSKKDQMFVYEKSATEKTEDWIADTSYTFEEAFRLANERNLIKEHEIKMRKLKL